MELKTFDFNENEIRIYEENGQAWFCLKDVCDILEIGNPSDLKTRLNEKGVVTTDTLTNGGTQRMTYINESNLYKAIFQSRKPEAEAFTEWVTSEVLPSIRKNGGYIAGQENQTPEEILANALVVAQKVIADRENRIAALKPKADYFDALVERNLLTNIRDTAKQLGIGEKTFIDWLKGNGYIYRDNGNKIKPYADHMELFSLKDFERNGHAGNQTLITPKGKETFRLRLQMEGLIK